MRACALGRRLVPLLATSAYVFSSSKTFLPLSNCDNSGTCSGICCGTCSDSSCDRPERKEKKRKKKKYVIVGAGVAGRACVAQLLDTQSNEEKDILIIDPNPLHATLRHLEATTLPIQDFDIESQTIELSSGEMIEFEKCLLSMGKDTSRIPRSFLSPDCAPEQVMYMQSSSSHKQLAQLKHLVLSHRHVTLLGGTWHSLFIASFLAQFQPLPGLVTIVLPGPWLLHQVLPRYLAEALTQRLKKQGIDILPYSQVRYIGGKETLQLSSIGVGDNSSNNINATGGMNVELDGNFVVMHMCSSFDSLRTSMFPTDIVVLSAEQDLHELEQQQEQEILQTQRFKQIEKPDGSGGDNVNSRAWLYRSGLELDHYGCVVVNRSLQASDNVYVAGDLASYPYPTGGETNMNSNIDMTVVPTKKKMFNPHGIVYQRGHDVGLLNAEVTGACAGRSMKQCRGRAGGSCGTPIYHAVAPHSGVDFRFFGDCSSQYSSFSFWSMPSSPSPTRAKSRNSKKNSVVPPKETQFTSNSANKYAVKNLFGEAGVVFYVDASNTIRGVLLCGRGDSGNITTKQRINTMTNDTSGTFQTGEELNTSQLSNGSSRVNFTQEAADCRISSPFLLVGKKVEEIIVGRGRDPKVSFLQKEAEKLIAAHFHYSHSSDEKSTTGKSTLLQTERITSGTKTTMHDKNCINYTNKNEENNAIGPIAMENNIFESHSHSSALASPPLSSSISTPPFSSSPMSSLPLPLRFIFARPRMLASASSGHPWRYSLHSSVATEHTFYHSKSNNTN